MLAPGIATFRRYDRSWFRGDLMAGVTVAAYLIPQCMAYADLAGLQPVAGLWAILPPMLLYAIFGSSPQLSVGPESSTAVMTAAAVAPVASTDGSDYASLAAALAIVVGGACLLGYLLHLGFLADLLSRPILVGYMAGIACIMVSGQLDKLIGVDIDVDGFFAEVRAFFEALDDAHLPTLLLSLSVLAFLFLTQWFLPRVPGPLVAALLATAVVAFFDLDQDGIAVVGSVPGGLPTPKLPADGLSDITALLGPALAIALVGYSDNVLTARSFAAKGGYEVDANQELLGLGTSNIGSGLFQGFPLSSSGSRTVLGDAAGSRSQMFSVVAFGVVIAVLLFLQPLLESFPDAALGAIVVYAAIKLIEIPEFRRLLAFRRAEFALALATTIGVLVTDILIGVLIAVGLSAVDLLARIARPHDAVLGKVPDLAGLHDIEDWPDAETFPGLVLYRYDAPLFFANAENFRARALQAIEEEADEVEWFVLDVSGVLRVDITAADMLRQFHHELSARGIVFGMARAKQELRAQLAKADLDDLLGPDFIFPTLHTALDAFLTREPRQR